LFLNIVIGKGATILELLPCEDETLLVGGNTLFILNLGFDVINSIRRFNLQGNRLS
ncbi:hypothetical protein BDQ17DRAFT_1203729, partial [Cyathus striatus]